MVLKTRNDNFVDPNVKDVIVWSIENTSEMLESSMQQWAVQGILLIGSHYFFLTTFKDSTMQDLG